MTTPSLHEVQANTAPGYDHGAPTDRLGPERCPFCAEEAEGVRRHSPEPCMDCGSEISEARAAGPPGYAAKRRESKILGQSVRERVAGLMREGYSLRRARKTTADETGIAWNQVYQYTRRMEEQ